MTLIAILVVIAVIALFLQRRRSGDKSRSAQSVSSASTLLRLCQGDASKMERLIALETNAAPSIERHVAIQCAIDRLRHDHR